MKNPTPEELKSEAIKKAWIAEIGEEKYILVKDKIESDGSIDPKYLAEIGVDPYWLDKPKGCRPDCIDGIENNNGWIRIEPDGSNFPESGEYWVVDTLNGIRDYLYHAKDGGDIIFWKNQVTHFQLINKPQPPIF